MASGLDFSSLASLPPAVLEVLPAMLPPPGVIPDFQHPKDISPLIIGLSSTAVAISTILFAIRCYNKAVVTRKLQWDDLTCVLGYLFILPLYVGIVWSCVGGILGRHQYEVHVSDVIKPAYLIGSAYFNVVFVGPMLMFVKLTFFLMYLEIFSPFRWMRICCIVGGTACAVFYTASTIAQFVVATPRRGESFAQHALSGEVFKLFLLAVPTAAIGLAFDIILLILPLVAVAQLNMPSRKKIGTSLLFATGILAIIGSILGVYFRQLTAAAPDQIYASIAPQVVSVFEGCFGLICVCMPSIAKVAQRHNLVKHANILFSRFTRLSSQDSLPQSSTTKSGQHADAPPFVLARTSRSVRFDTLTPDVGDLEEQQEKTPSYNVYISANGT